MNSASVMQIPANAKYYRCPCGASELMGTMVPGQKVQCPVCGSDDHREVPFLNSREHVHDMAPGLAARPDSPAALRVPGMARCRHCRRTEAETS